MRFFLDHCISNALRQSLEDLGHEAIRLRDHYRGKLFIIERHRVRVRR